MKNETRIPIGKPRNPYGDDYDGSHNAGRHEPKKERFKPDYEAMIEEEEHLLDPLDVEDSDDEAERIWREYLASQDVSSQTGKVTPK